MSAGGEGTVVFVPCRSGSCRVKRKNVRPFAGRSHGLLELKLEQLESTGGIDQVLVDSDDPEVLEFSRARQQQWSGPASLRVRRRPDELGRSETSTDELIRYALETVPCRTLVWTHVTAPLFHSAWYERALDAYRSRDIREHDSLLGVTPLRTFVWDRDGPLNYERKDGRWPQTQEIAPLYEVNSTIFIVSHALGSELGDRVGRAPLFFEVPATIGLDVDWEDDFRLAEVAYRALVEETD